MPARDEDANYDAVFEVSDAGQRLLELWTRIDGLAALVAVACTTARGIDQKPLPKHVMAVLEEILGLAEEARNSLASSREMASNLADTLAQIASRLDQWLEISGAVTVDGRPVAELRAKLAATIAPAIARGKNPRVDAGTAEARGRI